MITWVVGPLAFPSSDDWKYWTPTCEDGVVRAWYFPTGLPGSGDVLLGEFPDITSAQDACARHASDAREAGR